MVFAESNGENVGYAGRVQIDSLWILETSI